MTFIIRQAHFHLYLNVKHEWSDWSEHAEFDLATAEKLSADLIKNHGYCVAITPTEMIEKIEAKEQNSRNFQYAVIYGRKVHVERTA
ncbi:hypothetical protein DLJ48_06710 [Oenococcus sicerae]|uniref:Uncharacterized protein n=1 Tax=Oenococcus sicerae TaxID=2203724 RepID=A0ABX5QN43_9LACO|nr:hypothetical protein [Oenococcus sicerae]QAS70234.1 hypothetical protein DLJ48_06710 [Oenococcus sicerae]